MPRFEVELAEVRQETHDVKTFRFVRPEGLDFVPGQYCTLSFPDKFRDESRPFTFASSPGQKEMFELTIKKMGDFTSELFKLRSGDRMILKGPNGENLNFDGSVKEDVVFLAGGSGITPFMSAIRYASEKKLPNHMILFFSNRTDGDIIYRRELEGLKSDNIKIVHTLSDEWPQNWEGERGRISREMIERHVESARGKLWYICGPPPMVSSMKGILVEIGVPDEMTRVEDWQLPGKGGKN